MALTYSQMLPLGTELPKFKLVNVLTDELYSTENFRSEKNTVVMLSLIHISEPTRRYAISYAVFCFL